MANLQSLIAQVAKLPTETSRKVASLVGAIVGDAACLHLEWVYDQDKIPKIVPEGESPAFGPKVIALSSLCQTGKCRAMLTRQSKF